MYTDEDRAEDERFGELLRRLNDRQLEPLELTDEEWMSIIARERDGLPACCGNVSALRDVLISVARDDGEVSFIHRTRLAQALTWCFPSHDVPSDAIQKVLDQVGFEMPEKEDHMRNRHEL